MSRCSILQTSVSTTNRSARLARTWFTDEKIFTVQAPTNSQNDRVYANVAVKRDVPSERLLKGRKHFSQSIMVSVAVSQLSKSSLVFVERGAKVNSSYYCDVVLHQGLLPDIIAHSGDNFTFQQDGPSAHRSRKTIAFLTVHVPYFIRQFLKRLSLVIAANGGHIEHHFD